MGQTPAENNFAVNASGVLPLLNARKESLTRRQSRGDRVDEIPRLRR